jgi:hypothetical protein
VGMLEKRRLRLSVDEIKEALRVHVAPYDDEILMEFTRMDTLVYSLLTLDISDTYSFSHKSLYEYYLAAAALQDLEDHVDPDALLTRFLLSNEVITFLAWALVADPAHPFAVRFAEAFKGQSPLQELVPTGIGPFRKGKVLRRNLALLQLEMAQRLDGVNLTGLDFSGYRFLPNGRPVELVDVVLDRSEMEGAILTGAIVSGSLRSAKLNRCVLDRADLRGVDMTFAYLNDITCAGTRFSGANFTDVRVNGPDVDRIEAALRTEQLSHPGAVTTTWLETTIADLRADAG